MASLRARVLSWPVVLAIAGVLVALALNGIPIDVLAERLNTTRGALYKTLHDARRKLRTYLAEQGHDPRSPSEVAT